MKRILLFVCIQFFLLASFAGETINFCKSWKFHLGDAGKGASSSSYNDSQWRILNIPHDWSIEGTYKQFENGTDWQSGFLPAGISWYRKTFTIPSKWKNKKVQILFEGVYLNSEVWINGHWLGKRPNGYISFVYDLTPYLQEGKNQIAVKVDHSKALTGRWYTGSGIYRPVYLLVSNPTHIPYSGIHFRSKLQNKQSATYTLSIEIETQEKKPIKVKTYLQAPNGSIADTSEKIFVPSADSLCFLSGSIRKPLLWSPDSPNVYTLICQLTRGNGRRSVRIPLSKNNNGILRPTDRSLLSKSHPRPSACHTSYRNSLPEAFRLAEHRNGSGRNAPRPAADTRNPEYW